MSKAYTIEEKRQFVREACAKYETAQKCIEEAEALLKRCDVTIVSKLFGDAYEVDATKSIHIYSGIKKLAKILDQEPRHTQTIWRDGKVNRRELAVVQDGILFFQLGDEQNAATRYKYR